MDKIEKKALELLEQAFAQASTRRWAEIKSVQVGGLDGRTRQNALLDEEKASSAAKKRLMAIIGSEDREDGHSPEHWRQSGAI